MTDHSGISQVGPSDMSTPTSHLELTRRMGTNIAKTQDDPEKAGVIEEKPRPTSVSRSSQHAHTYGAHNGSHTQSHGATPPRSAATHSQAFSHVERRSRILIFRDGFALKSMATCRDLLVESVAAEGHAAPLVNACVNGTSTQELLTGSF